MSRRVNRVARDVVVEVEGTGMGMSTQQLETLVEPFNRLGRDGAGVEGTGIGLVLSRQLVDRMQGRLEIGCEPGRGTLVRLTLRQAQGQPRQARPVRSTAGPSRWTSI